VKGSLETIFDELRLHGLSYEISGEKFLHRGKAADILSPAGRIGYLGELGPTVISRLDLKISKPEIVVFELDLDRILRLMTNRKTYRQIPRFPAIERDMAVILDDGIAAADVMTYFAEYANDYIENIELFDYYKGKNMPPDKKSLAFRVIYRSPERTLTDTEVEPLHKGLVDFILARTDGVLRGV
jgi:phenylalanyl-tRNA synthetase beta chain